MYKAHRRGGRSSRSSSVTRYTKLTHPSLGVLYAGDSVRLLPPPASPPGMEMLARIDYFTRTGGVSQFLGFWYYRPADVEAAGGGSSIPRGTHPRELFLSDHSDSNPTSSILERVDVWSAADYEALLGGANGPALPVEVIRAGYVCRLLYGATDHSFRLLGVAKSNALEVSARRHGHAPGMAGQLDGEAPRGRDPPAAVAPSADSQADEDEGRDGEADAAIQSDDGGSDADTGGAAGDQGAPIAGCRSPPPPAVLISGAAASPRASVGTPAAAQQAEPAAAPPTPPSAIPPWPSQPPAAAGGGGLPPGGATSEVVPPRGAAAAAVAAGAAAATAATPRAPGDSDKDGRTVVAPPSDAASAGVVARASPSPTSAGAAAAAAPPPLPAPAPEEFAAVLATLDPPMANLSAPERDSLLVAHGFVSTALTTWLEPLGDTPVSDVELRRLFDEALRLYNARVAPSS